MEESSEDEEKAEPSTTPPPPPPPQPPPPSQPAQQQPSEVKIVEKQAKNGLLDEDDPILEMIDLTDDVEDRKDAKRGKSYFIFNTIKFNMINLVSYNMCHFQNKL